MNRVFAQLGASNHSPAERQKDDYYATHPKAVKLLMELEHFAPVIWEPASGEDHIANVLRAHGYQVRTSDLVERLPTTEQLDFLKCTEPMPNADIVTNPPYKFAAEFVERALELVDNGRKVAMLLRLNFLEGKARHALFEKYPPKTVWVSSGRLICAKNGDFETYHENTAVAYAWFVWEKGYNGPTSVNWFNY